jgi:LysR family transcriptional regulator, transcriptional activator for bauABCD operon
MLGRLGDQDLKLLRIFRTIVECGGFTAAQSLLNTSLPRLSTQVAGLEARLGVRLCQRGRVGFRLTDKGRQVYEASSRLFAGLEDFKAEIGELAGQLVGELRIGLVDNMISHPRARISQAITRFKQPDNAVQVSFRMMGPDEVERAVLDERIQLGIGAFHHHLSGLDYERLFEEAQSLYCGAGHPFFGGGDISASMIAATEFVERGYMAKARLRRGQRFNRTATAYDMESIAFLILSGKYIGFLPTHYAQRWVSSGDMREIAPARYSYISQFEFIVRRSRQHTMAVRRFIEALRESHRGLDG